MNMSLTEVEIEYDMIMKRKCPVNKGKECTCGYHEDII
jgi:hypothetical protein